MPNGACKATEATTYTPSKNISVFSECFSFEISSVTENSFFHIYLIEPNEALQGKYEIIGKKTMQLDKNLATQTNKIRVPTKYEAEAKIRFTLEMSQELLRKLEATQTTSGDNSASQSKGSGLSNSELDLLALGPLFKKFVEAVGPLVQLQQQGIEFIT